LKGFVARLTSELCGGRAFTCLLTGDAELERLNREFLGHAVPTDVLSFPSGEDAGPLGEIAISLDRAAAQAAEFGHTVEEEVRVLMLHGALHLLGHDHETDQGQMRRVESRWRRKLELPTGLIARAHAPRRRARA
jgi:probable rRNA maturation factor